MFDLRNLRIPLLAVTLLFATTAGAVPTEGTRIMISAPSAYAVETGKAIAAEMARSDATSPSSDL